MFSEEHLYSIALRASNLVGDIVFKKLIEAEGSAENVWKLPKPKLQNIFGIGKKISREIGDDECLKFAEKELAFCEKNNIKIHLRHLGELPVLLNSCEDAPAILYRKGELMNRESISIVGTRNITAYGKTFINDFLEDVKDVDLQTVSGLALGADTEVHAKSLEKNIKTIAVLAHGFHTLYPSKNKDLSEKILEKGGCLLTEFNSSQKPDRENFIQRNRIIAGFSPATIVVETAFGGGSISTASFANGYNRDVYALPGKITDKYSQGCNQLIMQNKAATISTIKDLVENLGYRKSKESMDTLFPKSELKVKLSDIQQQIYDVIEACPNINLDEIGEKLNFSTHKILPVLLELEILGVVKSFSGKQFQVV